jgi:hypothetical protein
MRYALYVCCLFISGVLQAGRQQVADPYSLIWVRNAMARLSVGVRFGGDTKTIPRLGDACSIALLKILDQRDLTDAKKINVTLVLIHEAFRYPESIQKQEDKQPKVTLFLLNYLLEKMQDHDTQRSIQETINFVNQQTGPD